MKKRLVGLLSLLWLVACAHHKDVRPGPDGIHKVVVQAEDNEQGTRNGIEQASHYCKQSNKEAAFLTEDKKYTGTMDESDYRKAKTAAKVATAAGAATHVFGGRNESTVGGVVGLGGGIADQALGKGYTVEMKFKCQ